MKIDPELKKLLNPTKSVLLVWDVQNNLVNRIFNRENFLVKITELILKARENQVQIIFSKSTPLPEKFVPESRKYLVKTIFKNMRPSTNDPNGMELAIEPEGDDLVIPKSSASIFIGTNFEMLLRNAGITTIIFTGIATEMGVESSARDASNRGLFPVIVTDAVSSFIQETHERSLENLKSMMTLLESDDLISLW
jgi:nicotinamidase-related amidase